VTADETRILYRLEGKVDNVLAEQESAKAELKHLARLPDKLSALEVRVAKLEPIADDFSRWRERGIGALMLISFFAAILGAAISAIWQKIVGLFTS
jgi:hypothetical protein